MRVRKLTASGDYQIGQGQANFWINQANGVGQKVTCRLKLWEGEWFLDNTIGTPYLQQILGYNTASLRDIALQAVIIQTPGVSAISSYVSNADPATRKFTVSGEVITIYSPTPVPFGPVVL
jgi:hypothetical protein